MSRPLSPGLCTCQDHPGLLYVRLMLHEEAYVEKPMGGSGRLL